MATAHFIADEAGTGTLHVYVAFDWGDEINLGKAAQLIPAGSHMLALTRRPRTPASIEYRPLPLQVALGAVTLDLPEIGKVTAQGDLTIFDFAAVSVAWRIPIRVSVAGLARLATGLASTSTLVDVSRQATEPLYQKLLPAIDDPHWSDLNEEYFVFQLPTEGLVHAAGLCGGPKANWLAGLIRLEATPFSAEEVEEALRLRMSYTEEDLFVPDWAAAVLIDRDCEETLEVIEFANLQLLEYRHIDRRLDDTLVTTYSLIHGLRRTSMPFWRTHAKPLRVVGDLKVEANSLFERTGNVLKMVGDQYLARVYRRLETRFHLDQWEKNIQRKLEVLEATYHTLAEQGATFRAEFLEWIIIALILVEVVMALWKH